MNDDDLDLRIYARAERKPQVLVRPAGKAQRATQELPAASEAAPAREAPPAGETQPAGEAGPPERRATMELPVAAEASVEDRVLRILRAPPEWSETVEGAFSRKERELAALFEALEPAEAGELFRRLSRPRGDDPVAMGFARLVPERRGRLLGVLIGAPRRAARARARRLPPQPRRRDG